MAALNFPPNPADGQFYPDPALPGVTQYVYSTAKGTWLTVSEAVGQVRGEAPIVIRGVQQTPIVTILPATPTNSGSMSAADKAKLDLLAGSVTKITAGTGLGAPNTGDSITSEGVINLLPATNTRLGGVIPAIGLSVNTSGQLNLTPAAPGLLGGVKPGAGLTIEADGTINATGGIVVLRDISPGFNGVQTQFALSRLDGSTYIPGSVNNLMLFVGGVIQVPNNAFILSGANVVFTSAPPAGATFYGVAIS